METSEPEPNRALDVRIAEQLFGVVYTFIHGDYLVQDPEDTIAYLVCPHYSSDIAAAFAVEEQIDRLGLAGPYASHLAGQVLGSRASRVLAGGVSEQDLFALAHASPAQRCIAALQALESQG
jgi:hypothetical protein